MIAFNMFLMFFSMFVLITGVTDFFLPCASLHLVSDSTRTQNKTKQNESLCQATAPLSRWT